MSRMVGSGRGAGPPNIGQAAASHHQQVPGPAMRSRIDYSSLITDTMRRERFVEKLLYKLDSGTRRVILVTAATGSGKSTLVPAVIAEWFRNRGKSSRVVCAEPHVLAAINLCNYVRRHVGDDRVKIKTQFRVEGHINSEIW